MRNSLRSLVDSGVLNAQAASAPVKKPAPANGNGGNGAPMQKLPAAPGQQPPGMMPPPEVHVHLHPADDGDGMDDQDPNNLDPSDPDSDPEDPSDEEQDEDNPSGADQTPGSPMAKSIAQTMQDPLGATKKTFGNLTKTKLAYNQAQEEAKRSVIPAMAVLQHVSNAHQLTPAMQQQDPNNPDQSMGYDEQGNPQNMVGQQPGAQQMGQPNNVKSAPGTGPAIPGGAPGAAGTRSQRQVVPPKMGVPQPGQSQSGTKAGNPGQDAKKGAAGKKNKSIKLEVQGSAYKRKPTRIEAAAMIHSLRFTGTSEGASKGWDTRGRGSIKRVDTTNFGPAAGVKYVNHSDVGDPEESAQRLKDAGYNVHKSTWIDQAGKAHAEAAKDKFVERAHGRGHDVVHADLGQDGYLMHEVSVR